MKPSFLRRLTLIPFVFLLLASLSPLRRHLPFAAPSGRLLPPPPSPDRRLLLLASISSPTPLLSDDLLFDDHFTDHHHYRRHRRYSNSFVAAEARRLLHSWSRLLRLRRPPLQPPASLLPFPAAGSGSGSTSCAVVGNSGILLSSTYGAAIDSHDYVIRLNNARVAGFAAHVGSKTNLSFINSNVLRLCARRGLCRCNAYGDGVPTLMYICQPAHFEDVALCSHGKESSNLTFTDPRFDLLCMKIVKYYSIQRFVEKTGRPPDEWKKARDELSFHYSSGMQAVIAAVGACGNVSLFGFGKSSGAKHHYHTNQKAELDLHDYEAEYKLYRDLAERPLEVPFLQDAGFKIPPLAIYQ